MASYGIFSDEGMTDGPFSRITAEICLAEYIIDDPDNAELVEIREVCPDHEEQPLDGCEECWAEENEEHLAMEGKL